jgi:hypothetical protein
MSVGGDWSILLLAFALLVVAAIIVHAAALGAQLMARAVWWSTFLLGVLLCVVGSAHESNGGLVVSLACGTALLVSGRKSFDAVGGARNVPPALRSMLMLLMIFALADAQTFLLFASVALLDSGSTVFAAPGALAAIGLSYVAGFVGLYRLEIWGAIVNMVTSLAAIVLLLTSEVIDKSDLRNFLVILSCLHIATAFPVTIAVLRGKSLPALPPRIRDAVAVGAIGLLMLVAVVMYFHEHSRF